MHSINNNKSGKLLGNRSNGIAGKLRRDLAVIKGIMPPKYMSFWSAKPWFVRGSPAQKQSSVPLDPVTDAACTRVMESNPQAFDCKPDALTLTPRSWRRQYMYECYVSLSCTARERLWSDRRRRTPVGLHLIRPAAAGNDLSACIFYMLIMNLIWTYTLLALSYRWVEAIVIKFLAQENYCMNRLESNPQTLDCEPDALTSTPCSCFAEDSTRSHPKFTDTAITVV